MIRSIRRIQFQPETIAKTSWKDYGVRFLFGGIITAAVGVIAKLFGPTVAGLFLAFPAILPASLTLASKHDGVQAAGLQAHGAAIGSVGLGFFAAVIWALASTLAGWLTLLTAVIVWLVGSLLLWTVIESFRHRPQSVDHRSKQTVESSDHQWGVAKR
jgi:hypothetical protein